MVKAKLMASRKDGGFGATPVAVDYCWFADANAETPFKKRTCFWTNSPSLIRELGAHMPPLKCTRLALHLSPAGPPSSRGQLQRSNAFPPTARRAHCAVHLARREHAAIEEAVSDVFKRNGHVAFWGILRLPAGIHIIDS